MTQRDDLVSLGDMLDADREARQIAAGIDKASFKADRLVQLALMHLIQTIGEAARDASAQGRATLPQIPWPSIVGMRHRIVHDYRKTSISTACGSR